MFYCTVAVQTLSHVWLFATPWTAARHRPCPFPSPEACSNSCTLTQWWYPTTSSCVVPFSSCLQSFPASGSFPMSPFFVSGDQSIGASVSASVLQMNVNMKVAQSSVGLFATPWTIYVHEIFQARIMEWVAFPFSRASSQPRDWSQVFTIADRFFTSWATREAQEYRSGSVSQFSHSVGSGCLWPHGLQHTRNPCPSPTPGLYSNSCPFSQWCHPTISSSVIPFSSCL